jgi:hypothetical protein
MWQDRISQPRDFGPALQSQGRRRRGRHSVFVMYWRRALHDVESQRIRAGAKGRGEAGSRKAGSETRGQRRHSSSMGGREGLQRVCDGSAVGSFLY